MEATRRMIEQRQWTVGYGAGGRAVKWCKHEAPSIWANGGARPPVSFLRVFRWKGTFFLAGSCDLCSGVSLGDKSFPHKPCQAREGLAGYPGPFQSSERKQNYF